MSDEEPNSLPPRVPERQVRALFGETTLRVYQAFSPEIAERAAAAQTFKPPFKRDRMTWIKPSFAWMMHRSGWATKAAQERVLGIDILRSGFEWALSRSCTTRFSAAYHGSPRALVRIQWDPERTLLLEALPWRTIQMGLRGEALSAYVDEWICGIEDVTVLVRQVEAAVKRGDLACAIRLAPRELPYPLPIATGEHID